MSIPTHASVDHVELQITENHSSFRIYAFSQITRNLKLCSCWYYFSCSLMPSRIQVVSNFYSNTLSMLDFSLVHVISLCSQNMAASSQRANLVQWIKKYSPSMLGLNGQNTAAGNWKGCSGSEELDCMTIQTTVISFLKLSIFGPEIKSTFLI